MELVLSDIAKWKTQLEGEIIKIDEQVVHLKATKKVAEQKVKEAEAILAAHDFTAPAEDEVEAEVEAEPVAEAAEG